MSQGYELNTADQASTEWGELGSDWTIYEKLMCSQN